MKKSCNSGYLSVTLTPRLLKSETFPSRKRRRHLSPSFRITENLIYLNLNLTVYFSSATYLSPDNFTKMFKSALSILSQSIVIFNHQLEVYSKSHSSGNISRTSSISLIVPVKLSQYRSSYS